MASHGQQHGYGRRNDDSSSSRESSPVRKTKRSFTPTSDDDDVIIQPVDHETPPPESAPLIRQPVAFTTMALAPGTNFSTTPLNTYKAKVLESTKNSSQPPKFLPGQAVTLPPPAPKPRRKKNAPRDPNITSKTSRFRVDSYHPGRAEPAPVVVAGGPYNSAFRADDLSAGDGQIIHEDPSAPKTSRKKAKPADAGGACRKPTAGKSKGKAKDVVSRPTSRPTTPNITLEESMDVGHFARDSSSDATLHEQGSVGSTSTQPFASSYYRRDYDRRKQVAGPTRSRRSEERLGRLVTVLMEDRRNDMSDNLLVELRLNLRDTDNVVQDGYWADSGELCRTLQASAARIDGPAKVFALRDKFRQPILKVSPDNEDDWVSANVAVSNERTVKMIIETLPPNAFKKRPMPEPSHTEYCIETYKSPRRSYSQQHIRDRPRSPDDEDEDLRRRLPDSPHDPGDLMASGQRMPQPSLAMSETGHYESSSADDEEDEDVDPETLLI